MIKTTSIHSNTLYYSINLTFITHKKYNSFNIFMENTDNTPIITPYQQFWPGQLQLFKAPPHSQLDIFCYQGGYGSGKTFAGSLLGLLLAFKYPGSTGMVVAKTWPLLRHTTLRSYFDHLNAMGLEAGVHFTYKATEQCLMLYNGSEILFRHMENPDAVKSLNCAWVEVEEMGLLSEDDFLMLLSRLR
jgi:phage terminase large subunit